MGPWGLHRLFSTNKCLTDNSFTAEKEIAMFSLIILTFTLSVILGSMGFFIVEWGIFFCVYQRTKAALLHNRSCSCKHFAGEPGKFFFFTADILWYHFDTYLQFRSLVKISLSVSLFLFSYLQISTVNWHFFHLTSRLVYLTQNL